MHDGPAHKAAKGVQPPLMYMPRPQRIRIGIRSLLAPDCQGSKAIKHTRATRHQPEQETARPVAGDDEAQIDCGHDQCDSKTDRSS
jgi:hypothetical protein